ncbi:CgeB family protein [Pelagibacterium luteolum]|uniref:Spore maturation protein CgeB n=1 Tax=Pelagibacterium luteolum TaxID=440168 RepID=A0A1G8A5R0_9HYPH|nr:glycosyltransferase [Pelagibacterium luteolum]SDH16213.1 Spore maturation protein CgeB [Pelagibacterium luteolum]
MSRFDIVIIGLTLSSSWGNGHATTYRSLLRGLRSEGARVLFLECDMPWYASNRDLPDPNFCTLELFENTDDLFNRFASDLGGARSVIIGSYVPDGPHVIDRAAHLRPNLFCFYDIDTPVTLAKLDNGDEEYLRRDQIGLFDAYFSFSGGRVLKHLERCCGAKRALPLYCSVDEARYYPLHADKLWDLGYLGTYSPDRQPTLNRLLIEPARRLPHKRFVVAGPHYPEDIDWPSNVDRIDHLPPGEHNLFYNQQMFALNVTRAAMVAAGSSPSVRLFEAGGTGTPIITDRWEGLDEFFAPGRAILPADGTDDVVAILKDMDETTRSAIANSARETTLASHTGKARASQLLAHLAQLELPAIAPQHV